MTENIHDRIDYQLRKRLNPQFAESRNRLIGKNIQSYGVAMSEIRKIAKKYLNVSPHIIEDLLSNEILDIQLAGVFLTAQAVERINYQDWIEKYINNWAVCDTFATEILSPHIQDNNQILETLYSLAGSENEWSRRVALVSLIKARGKLANWRQLLTSMLQRYSDEQNPIVKKAIHWAKDTLSK